MPAKQGISNHSYTVINNVSVVDVEKGKIIPFQTVIIKDSLIEYVGAPRSMPQALRLDVVDGTGKFLMPGLWDMHGHICWEKTNDSLLFPILLDRGVTGVRDMGGDLAIQSTMQKSIATDASRGPLLLGSGPILDGKPGVWDEFSIHLDDQADVDYLLDSLVKGGAAFFKTYSLIREPQLAAIARYARKHEMAFAGHLSEYIEPEVSIQLGQKSIEHLNRLEEIWNKDSVRMHRIATVMVNNNTWLCPTLITYFIKANITEEFIQDSSYDASIHPSLQKEWKQTRDRFAAKAKDTLYLKAREMAFEQQKKLVAMLHQKGVKILAGSDFAGMAFVYPGIGLHQELELLTMAGLSNAAALASATINPAVYLGISNKYGSVSSGKYANLVLLRNNPLEAIRNTRAITLVFRNGKKCK